MGKMNPEICLTKTSSPENLATAETFESLSPGLPTRFA